MTFEEIEDNLTVKHQDEWAEFTDGRFTPSLKWRRFSESNKRFYWTPIYKEGTMTLQEIRYGIGITTAISRSFAEPYALKEWKEKTPNWQQVLIDSSEYGTLLHICISDYVKDGTIDENKIAYAQKRWRKGSQLKKDLLAFIKFKIEYNLVPIILEGILSSEPFVIKGENGDPDKVLYICTAIDSIYSGTIRIKKKRLVDTGELLKTGPNKGKPKMVEERYEEEKTIYAMVDYKSNFLNKATKNFFESHRQQLIFGRHVFCREFNVPEEDVKIFNWSPNNWETEPTYSLTEHTEKTNSLGFTDSEVMGQKLLGAFMAEELKVDGQIMRFMPDFGTSNIDRSYIILNFEECILMDYFGVDIFLKRETERKEKERLEQEAITAALEAEKQKSVTEEQVSKTE